MSSLSPAVSAFDACSPRATNCPFSATANGGFAPKAASASVMVATSGTEKPLLIDVNIHDESQSTGAACSQRSKADQRAWRRQSSKESGSVIAPPSSASARARAESATSGAIM